MSDTYPHKRIAKIKSTRLGFDDHDLFTLTLDMSYGSSSGQCIVLTLGSSERDTGRPVWTPDAADPLWHVLRAAGVQTWEALKGRTVFVLLESDRWNANPIGLAPLPTEQGEAFVFGEAKP